MMTTDQTTDGRATTALTTEPGRWVLAARRLGVIVALGVLGVGVLGVGAGLGVDRYLLNRGETDPEPSAAIGGVADPPSPAVDRPIAGRSAGDRASPPNVETTPASSQAPTGVPERASRLVAQAPERVLDTRDGDVPTPDATHQVTIETGPSAVALSISAVATERPGAILVDGRAGTVEAVTASQAGTTTTNLVIVPVLGDTLTFRSTAGGHVVADIVGTFEPTTGSNAGRFVPIEATTIGRLETAVDGRELDLTFTSDAPYAEAEAVLVSITADVGRDGGTVQLGPTPGGFDQALMWQPTGGDDRQRRGLALVEPTPERLAALRYEGGTELTVDVLGYFTGDDAPHDTAGLFVINGPRVVVDGVLAAGQPTTFTLADVDVSAALVIVGSNSAVPGRMGSVLLPADGPTVAITPSQEIDATITLLGVFLA